MFGKHPYSKEGEPASSGVLQAPECPVCKSREFDARQTEFEVLRTCRKCGNAWSGGTFSAARPDLTTGPPPPPGVPVPEDDPVDNLTIFRPWE